MKEDKVKVFIEESLKIAPSLRRDIIQTSNLFDELKISPHQHMTLNIIHKHSPISMTDLALKLGVSNQQMTRIMDSLVQNNLVERFTSPNSRRVVLTRLTDIGLSILQNMKQLMIKNVAIVLSELSEEELDKCIYHFKEINNILTKLKR